jgi:outer membrane biosynthesis protein TonB
VKKEHGKPTSSWTLAAVILALCLLGAVGFALLPEGHQARSPAAAPVENVKPLPAPPVVETPAPEVVVAPTPDPAPVVEATPLPVPRPAAAPTEPEPTHRARRYHLAKHHHHRAHHVPRCDYHWQF